MLAQNQHGWPAVPPDHWQAAPTAASSIPPVPPLAALLLGGSSTAQVAPSPVLMTAISRQGQHSRLTLLMHEMLMVLLLLFVHTCMSVCSPFPAGQHPQVPCGSVALSQR